MDSSLPGSSVHGFSRQVYWSGLPCPSPRNLLNPGIEPRSTALQVDSWPSEPSMKLLTLVRQFSHSIMSDSLWPHGLQHTRLLYPSSTPGACSNLCPLSQWCHLTISSSAAPLSPFAFDLSRHQDPFQRVSSLHQVAKVMEFQVRVLKYFFLFVYFGLCWIFIAGRAFL